MKEKTHILLLFSVILLLFIAGCEGGGDVTSGAPTTPFLGGSEGLVVGFLEGNPPEEVTDGDTFPFQAVVSLKNMGEYDVETTDAKISLSGFFAPLFQSDSPADFDVADLIDKPLPDILKGRQRDSEGNIIESVEMILTFPTDTKSFQFKGRLEGNTIFDGTFRADVCYKYQTKVVSEICVLANQIDVANDAVCEPNGPKAVFSSGSPLQVTSFKQSVVGKDSIQLSFDVAHSSSGNVFDPTTVADCPKTPTERRTKEDKVKVTIDTGLTADKLRCVGLANVADATTSKQEGVVKLVNGKRTITCTQDLDTGRTDFKKSADITLDFNYLSSTDERILVKHLID
ncbi:hypothetical protein CMO94_02985 [Candidatus Woesearchaeota archaeon]|nr:hypothetical protein [Candidatus Woesearchaeota archaeon]